MLVIPFRAPGFLNGAVVTAWRLAEPRRGFVGLARGFNPDLYPQIEVPRWPHFMTANLGKSVFLIVCFWDGAAMIPARFRVFRDAGPLLATLSHAQAELAGDVGKDQG